MIPDNPLFTISLHTHKGDVLFIFTKPVTKFGLSVEEAEKIAENLATAIKQARAELEEIKPTGRKQ